MHVRGAWPAMPYICLYSVHPYWWKRQVLHQLWPSGSQHASKNECRQNIHSGFETHEEGHTKFKTGAISGSTKWTLVQIKISKKKRHRHFLSSEFSKCSCGFRNVPIVQFLCCTSCRSQFYVVNVLSTRPRFSTKFPDLSVFSSKLPWVFFSSLGISFFEFSWVRLI